MKIEIKQDRLGTVRLFPDAEVVMFPTHNTSGRVNKINSSWYFCSLVALPQRTGATRTWVGSWSVERKMLYFVFTLPFFLSLSPPFLFVFLSRLLLSTDLVDINQKTTESSFRGKILTTKCTWSICLKM